MAEPTKPTIQAAHDLITGILLKRLPCPEDEDEARLRHYAEVLCWVLGHTVSGSAGGDFMERLHDLASFVALTKLEQLAGAQKHRVN